MNFVTELKEVINDCLVDLKDDGFEIDVKSIVIVNMFTIYINKPLDNKIPQNCPPYNYDNIKGSLDELISQMDGYDYKILKIWVALNNGVYNGYIPSKYFGDLSTYFSTVKNINRLQITFKK